MIFDRNQDIFTCPETLNLTQTGFSWFVLIPFQQGNEGLGGGTLLLPGRGGSHGTHLGLVDTWRWGAFSNVIQGNVGHLITVS